MTEKLVYLVQRYEMPLDNSGMFAFPEKVFLTERAAQDYCRKNDPEDNGFEYTCPCGCGDVHWRSWDVVTVVMEDDE
jgi:hypothetical protein